MAAKNIAVFSLFPHRASFEYAICALKAAGFRDEDISVLVPNNSGSQNVATKKAAKSAKQAATTDGAGPAIQAPVGWLSEPRELFIQGDGSFLVAGPLINTLTGGETDGKVSSLMTTLLSLGIPEHEVKWYRGRIRQGGALMSVQCDDPGCAGKAKDSLRSTGAENICSTIEPLQDPGVLMPGD